MHKKGHSASGLFSTITALSKHDLPVHKVDGNVHVKYINIHTDSHPDVVVIATTVITCLLLEL